MKTLFVLSLIVISFCLTETYEPDEPMFIKYQEFLRKYNKTYSSLQELNERFNVFMENYIKLQNLKNTTVNLTNYDEDEGDKLDLGETDFFDLTDEEYHEMLLNYTIPEEEIDRASKPSNESFVSPNETDSETRHLQSIPVSFDWRQRGAVGVVKHQGGCGVCYAFAVNGNIEGLYAIKYGQLLNFSEQQILNCDNNNYGCAGGIISRTYDYLARSNGLGLQSSLRYTQRKGPCYAIRGVARIIGKRFAGSNNGYTIAAFLVSNGPLAAGVNANMFKYYRGGVMSYSNAQCAYSINHAVVIVGYGRTNTGINYWIVKNSWGPYWGERGYIRIAWGTCAINKYVLTGILA
jgi:C1A family cysteine protease